MYISHVAIENFKALQKLDFDLGPTINVIVGANAIGKTTILQAIRLTKAIAAPRSPNEAFQTLISLGAASPHFPQRVFSRNLARDATRPVAVRCTYSLTDAEIAELRRAIASIARNIVAARFGHTFANPANVVQLLGSPAGQLALREETANVEEAITRLETGKKLVLGIRITPETETIVSVEPIAGPLIAHLDQRLPPSVTLFSYFPADRALPMGDINLQLGGQDSQQRLEAHNSQPQLKYQHAKAFLLSSIITDPEGRSRLTREFDTIFKGILKGRIIKGIRANELGLMSILIEETETGRIVELDGLSSGEKNLILTFLTVAMSIETGGVVLFDEPELHLSPIVCKELLSFIMKNYTIPRQLQFIVCTHSPEIVQGAFLDDDCNLLHVKSPTDISVVAKTAMDEFSNALARLGTSVSENLLYEATVSVEGVDDIEFLETAFPDLFRRKKLRERGGRKEVEKVIEEIQALEKTGESVAPIYFIFDHDEQPTNFVSSPAVRVLQWQRRCAENYLIDPTIIADLLKDPNVTRNPINSAGEVRTMMQEIAFRQLDAIAARYVYQSYGYKNASLQKEDLEGPDIEAIATKLSDRLRYARDSLAPSGNAEWRERFVSEVKSRREQLSAEWEGSWTELCDGKRFLVDFYHAAALKHSQSSFRMMIARGMRDRSSELWRSTRDLLSEFLQTRPDYT